MAGKYTKSVLSTKKVSAKIGVGARRGALIGKGAPGKLSSRLKGKLVGKAASVGYESHASCGDW